MYEEGRDWRGPVFATLIGIVVILALVTAGAWILNRGDDDDTASVEPTPTPTTGPTISVYACPDDDEVFEERLPEDISRVIGRTADRRWLAIENGDEIPSWLWVLASDIDAEPDLNVPVLQCASTDEQTATPTPREVTPTPTDFAEGRDPELEAAVSWLQGG